MNSEHDDRQDDQEQHQAIAEARPTLKEVGRVVMVLIVDEEQGSED